MRNQATLVLSALALLILVAVLTACPQDENDGEATGEQASQTAGFTPSGTLPESGVLLTYGDLWLGMSEFDISQVYNAPKGRGDGFWRVIEPYDDVSIHRIIFEHGEGEGERFILAEFFRDSLVRIIDRRDGIDAALRDVWFAKCVTAYGDTYETLRQGSSWRWGDTSSLSLTFAQDNASEYYMNAYCQLTHQPSLDAAQAYLTAWEEAHPDHTYPEY